MEKRLKFLEMRAAATLPELRAKAPARAGNLAAVACASAPAPLHRPLSEARLTILELENTTSALRTAKFNFATDSNCVELL